MFSGSLYGLKGGYVAINQNDNIISHSWSIGVNLNDSTRKFFQSWSLRGEESVRSISAFVLTAKFSIISCFSL
jgi:hypothetical protein